MPTLLRAVGRPTLEPSDGAPLQDGCRSVARSAVFAQDTDADELNELGVTDGTSALRWDCQHGVAYRFDLPTDPTGIAPVDRS